MTTIMVASMVRFFISVVISLVARLLKYERKGWNL